MSFAETPQTIAERNLIFAGIALEKGALRPHQINYAFTLWVCDKSKHLGEILVEMKVLTEQQKQAFDREVVERLSVETRLGEALGSLASLEELSSQLEVLLEEDLEHPLAKAKEAKKAEKARTTIDDLARGAHATPEARSQTAALSATDPEQPLSDRFEPIDYLPSQGGMGELWIAKDKELNRYVVMKFIKRFRAHDSLSQGLFHLEGEVTGHLEHPNIPPVYSLGKDPFSRDFYAMRYFKGRKLTEAIREYHALAYHDRTGRKEKLVELLQTFQTVCLTVEFAHHHGVIHCDLKPDNIMVGPYGETLVIDWGLVIIKAASIAGNLNLETDTFHKERQAGFQPSKTAASGLHEKQGGSRDTVGGTLQYMPPEQLRATETREIDQIGFASDIFGLGATLYHLLCGKAPYLPKTKEKEPRTRFIERIRRAEFPLPRTIQPDIARPLESIVKKAMAADPKQRYATARELADDVRRWLLDEPVRAHPEGIVGNGARWLRRNRKPLSVGIVLLCISLLVGGLLILREQQNTQRYANRVRTIANNGFRMVEAFEPWIASEANFDAERKKILIDSAQAYQEILADFSPDDRTKRMAAHLFRVAANLHRNAFETTEAEPLYLSAIGIYQELARQFPNDDQNYFRLALLYVDYGQLYVALGQWDEARKITESAQREMHKTIKEKMPRPEQVRIDGLTFLALAVISHAQDRFPQSTVEAGNALSASNSLKSRKIFKGYDYIMLQDSLTLLGMNLREQNKLEESTVRMQEARDTLNPMNEELKAHDQNTVRDISKLDFLQSYIKCKLEQNLSLLKAKKDLEKIGPSLNSIVEQAQRLVEAYPASPRLKILHSAALAVRGNYYLTTNNLKNSNLDFELAKHIINNLIIKYPAIISLKTKHMKFIESLEVH